MFTAIIRSAGPSVNNVLRCNPPSRGCHVPYRLFSSQVNEQAPVQKKPRTITVNPKNVVIACIFMGVAGTCLYNQGYNEGYDKGYHKGFFSY